MVAPKLADQAGRVLGGRYRLLSQIGSGSSGRVYLAEDAQLSRNVAVKLLHPALADNESALKRFLAEAKAAGAMSHPHIVSVLDWGQDEGEYYLVLGYLAGGSLQSYLSSGRLLSIAQAAAVGAEAAAALSYAHGCGIVHRDIKPANLLFDEAGHVRVADFGIARALEDNSLQDPAVGLVGTALYAAPEQARSSRVGPLADVYSLGLVLVEAVTGVAPFAASSADGSLRARLDSDFAAPAELGALAPVVEAACKLDPTERVSAADLARQLVLLRASLPLDVPLDPLGEAGGLAGSGAAIASTHASMPQREAMMADQPVVSDALSATWVGAPIPGTPLVDVATPATTEASAAVEPKEPKGRRRRRRWIWLAAASVFLGAAGGATFAEWTTLFPPPVKVPSLIGMSNARVRSTLAALRLRLAVAGKRYDSQIPSGHVAVQSPFPSTVLHQGDTVSVLWSLGPPPRPVPDLSGDSAAAAAQMLQAALFHEQVSYGYSSSIPKGDVVSWAPSKGNQPAGSVVAVVISKGPQPIQVPQLVSKQYQVASATLSSIGLVAQSQLTYSTKVPAGQVIAEKPGAGSSLLPGSTVVLVVSEGSPSVRVPSVLGDTKASAASALQKVGLKLGTVYGSAKGRVLFSVPAVGSKVPAGTKVDIYMA